VAIRVNGGYDGLLYQSQAAQLVTKANSVADQVVKRYC
jgi:hypothetical protein